MPVHALFFGRADHALDHAGLLRAARRDELLARALTAHQGRVVAARKDRAVAAAKREWCQNFSQRTEPGDQGMFERARRRAGLAAARQMPAKQLSRVAVDHQWSGARRGGHRWYGLNARP